MIEAVIFDWGGTLTLYVGDRPYDDVSGAKAVGMRAVLVPHSDIPPHQQVPVDVTPDGVIACLSELPELIEAGDTGEDGTSARRLVGPGPGVRETR